MCWKNSIIAIMKQNKKKIKNTYVRICVEMDFNKCFLAEINLMAPNYVWVQKLDYKNILFWCKSCYEKGNVMKKCPKYSWNRKD